MRLILSLMVIAVMASCVGFRPPKNPKKPGKMKTFGMRDSLLGGLHQSRSCFDVRYYDLDLKLDPKKATVEGVVGMDLEIVEETELIQLDLDPQLEIHSVHVDGKETSVIRRMHESFEVDLGQTFSPGNRIKVEISYSGKPKTAKKPPWKGGFVFKKKKGSPFCGVACEDDGAHLWWPLKDHISDKPDSIRAAFQVPNGLSCISNGRLLSEEDQGNGWTKFTWATAYPINNYNVTFYIGNYVQFSLPYEGKYEPFAMDFYVLPHHLEKAKTHFRQARNIIYVYEDLFGPYPWPKDGYKLVESPYEGMEHQSAIAYGAGYKNRKFASYDYIILHETAHEWWGNAVSCCDMADLWIHEGFATYAEMLYEEQKEADWFYKASYSINRMVSENKRPVVGPMDVAYTNFKDGDIYTKGACILHNLRIVIDNDKLFKTIIKRFSMENRSKCVTTGDFISLVEEETGKDYQWYFDQYVHRREAPELFYHLLIDAQDGLTLFYRWNKTVTNESFDQMPVKFEVDEETQLIYPSTELKSLKVSQDATSICYLSDEGYWILTEKKMSELR